MPSLLETLNALLTERHAPSTLAARIGRATDDTAAAVEPALARIIEGLASLAADESGAATVARLVDDHDGPPAGELDDLLDRASPASGNVILDRVFGAERGLVVIGLASALGLAPSLVGRLLPLLAPLVTAELSRRCDASGPARADLVELLARDRRAIAEAGLLDGTTFDATAIEPVEVETIEPVEAAGIETLEPVEAAAIETMELVEADAAVGGRQVVAGATAATTAAEALWGGGVGDVAVVETDVEPEPDGTADVGPEPSAPEPADARGAALASLGWAVGAVILVLLLAWLLSTCGGAAAEPERAATVIDIDRSHPGAELGVDDDVGAEPSVVVSAPAAPQTAPAVPVTTGVGAGSDASVAGSITESELQGAVDATLRDSGVTGVVATDLVTLTGTVVDEQTRDGIEARIAVLLGVAAIDNRITIAPPVPVPAPEPAPAGTTLNDLLALEPVTFTSGSADLTPGGRAVIDRVAAHLLEQPRVVIEIAGHTDDDGAEEANLELSRQRSDAVRDHLVASGVAADRLTVVAHGEADPKVPNDSLDNKAINRRIEFIVR